MDMDFIWTTRAEKLQVVEYWWREQGGRCCLCGHTMKPYHRQHSVDPESATIEHIIPRRDNGPNTVGNVRLAHAVCNHALGALHEQNKHRAEAGKPLLSEQWAMTNAWARLRDKCRPITQEELQRREAEKIKRKKRGVSWCAANALSLPRGATLKPENQEALGILVRQRVAKPKMTAQETAAWLRSKGIRGA